MCNALVAPTIALAVKYYLVYKKNKKQRAYNRTKERRLKPLTDYFNKPSP